jgi:hypothetical protein
MHLLLSEGTQKIPSFPLHLFDSRNTAVPDHVGIAVGKVALGQVFSEYFGFPRQLSVHQFHIQ